MFFNGTLQEGIASSLQQNKSVVCFVTDDGEESQLWESNFLTDSSLQSSLRNEAVLLRLTAGSEEAGYLAAIFPLPKTPTLVIIKNGDLKGYIAAGTTKEDFIARVSSAFSAVSQTSTAAQHATPASAPATIPQASPTSRTTQPGAQSSDSSPGPSTSGPPNSSQAEDSSANVRDVLAERAARLEAQRRESERKAKEARAAKAAAAANDTSPEAVETRKHSEKLRKQRQEAAEERNRILRRIEDDKLERHARAAASASATAKQQPKLGDVATSLTSVESSPMKPRSGQAAVQVRLFDGSSLRTRFDSGQATLKSHVRKWVDESRTDGTEPYTFKVMLPPPHSSRKIDETEEGKTLAELGLAPSATLMLAPVHKFAEAYASPRDGLLGMLLSPFGFIAGIFAWLWGLVTGVFSRQGGRDGSEGTSADRDRVEAEAQAARVREQRAGRFTQFANPDDQRRDQQLYNGNSLNFEPRPDGEDES